MQSDEEVIRVVSAHKEGKKIESKWNRNPTEKDWELMKWHECKNPSWDFGYYDYRVAPEPRKLREYWIDSNASNGPWSCWSYVPSYPSGSLEQRCLVHVREVDDGATSGGPTVASDTVKASQIPREWVVAESLRDGTIHGPHWGTTGDNYRVIRVREVLE